MSKVIFNTSGDGYWTSVINAQVEITDIQVVNICDDLKFAELRVFFDPKTWDVETHGLIYTDSLFLKQLKKFLNSHGLAGVDVSYSEQGMQGDDYVSLDIGEVFLRTWGKKFGIDWAEFHRIQEEKRRALWISRGWV